jgi:RimJ/RimL family protein N-acetyltransferase
MEEMPYQPRAAEAVASTTGLAESLPTPSNDWRTGLPTLTGSMVTLRELRLTDAPALLVALTTEEVTRFISRPPATVEALERFIAWTHRQRAAGQDACFAVVPRNSDIAIGLFQVRSLEPNFGTAEWGFALMSEYWGTGVFADGAKLVVRFTFDAIGSHRLEARAATVNGRGNGALRKMGAVREGVLRKAFLCNGDYLDQTLWTLLAEEWRDAKATWGSPIIH